jgi:hypothetical protein
MPFARVRVLLLPVLDDPPIDSGELQSVFGKFRQFLCISNIPISAPMFYAAETDAEGYVGEFIVPLAQALRPPLSLVVSAWVQLPPGRTVHVRIGETFTVLARPSRPRFFCGAHSNREPRLCRSDRSGGDDLSSPAYVAFNKFKFYNSISMHSRQFYRYEINPRAGAGRQDARDPTSARDRRV